jgi:uncharacterized protein involved in outer membrane biogenesis
MSQNTEAEIQGFDEKPRKFPVSKGWIISGIVLLVLVAGAALIIPNLIDQEKYKGLIQQKVSEATGYTVDWTGEIGISLLPLPSAHLNNLTLSNGAVKVLTLKEADIRVALLPLLSKQVEIVSIDLKEPEVILIVDKKGNATWMSEKFSDQADGKDKAHSGSTPSVADESAAADVTLNALKITNGRLLFKNEQTGASSLVENLDSTLRAESLTGPYAIKGDLVYDKKNIEFDLKAGKIDGNGQSYPVNGKISLPDLKVNGEYAGIVASSPMKVEGELTVAADDLGNTVTAFTGSAPDLPEELDGAFYLRTKLLYDGKQAHLNTMRIAVGELSYNGNVAVTNLKGSAPPLTIDLSSEKRDVKSSSPLVTMLSNLSVKGTGSFADNRVTINNGAIKLDDQDIALTGTYALAAAGKRPVIDMAVKAGAISVDKLTGALSSVDSGPAPAAKPGSTAKKNGNAAKGTSLPFDGHLKADIGSLTVSGRTYSPLKADIVSKGNALVITSLTAGTVADTTLTAKGRIGNLPAMSDFDLTGSLRTSDAEALMTAFNIKAPELPQKLGAVSVNGSAQGSLDRISFNGTANALKFAVTGQGSVDTPMTKPAISALNLHVKHPQLAEAVRVFQPEFNAPPSLRGPLDLSATVAWDGNKYNLTGIKGALGSTSIAGDLAIVKDEPRPSVSGALSFGDVVFDAAGGESPSKSSSASSGKASSSPAAARWSSDPINTAWMKAFDADLTVKALSITQDMWKLNNANLAFKLSNGALSIDDLSAGMFGGKVVINGNAKSGASDTTPLSLSMAMQASNVDARQLQSALTGKPSDTINGTISDLKIDISSNGASPSALVNALNGEGSMAGRNLIIKGIDAAKLAETAKGSFKPLERAGSLFNTFQSGQTQFDTFVAAFGIQRGVVNFNQLKFDGEKAMIEGRGQVDLPRWTINLTNTITVKNTDIPPFDLTIQGTAR